MATTTILLREDVENLGGRGDIVKVKSGFARNYLLPRNIATLATKGNVKQIEQERTALLKKAAQEKSTAEAQAGQMRDIALSFERKAGDGGQLFGSVTTIDIAQALQAKGYEIDRRKIALKDAIKVTGDYTVNVKLHREVTLEIPVTVTAEGGASEDDGKVKKSARGKAKKSETAETAAEGNDSALETAEETAE